MKRKTLIFSTPKVPVSWGELIDKITVLEIKETRIKSSMAVANVKKELSYLLEIAEQAISADPYCGELKRSLQSINNQLWEVEDKIREKEHRQEFDEVFVSLARSVYKLNDERANIKKQINTTLSSEIVEEKSYKEFSTKPR